MEEYYWAWSCHSTVNQNIASCLPACSEIAARRKSQVGTGSRSEKIKTYNYKDSRMSGGCGSWQPWQWERPTMAARFSLLQTLVPHPKSQLAMPGRSPPVADHRTKVNYDLNKVMEGGLEDSIQSMLLMDQQEMLKELMEASTA